MTQPKEVPRDGWEERFDKTWPNLSTFVPMLGQGDARRAVKDFIRKEIEEAVRGRDEQYQPIFDWLLGQNGEFPNVTDKPHYAFRTELHRRLSLLKETN